MLRNTVPQSGMTLVELMMAMVISSVIVYFLFSIQSRMSSAFRGQSTVSEINQSLHAAKQQLANDIRVAGFGIPGGSIQRAGVPLRASFTVTNNIDDGNDRFQILYGTDTNAIAVTMTCGGGGNCVTGLTTPQFAAGQMVVIANADQGCINSIVSIDVSNDEITLGESCNGIAGTATMRPLIIRSYRIDPNRDDGYLQMSTQLDPTTWVDIGVGFVTLQLASQYFVAASATDLDSDGDAQWNWYSGNNQTVGNLNYPVGGDLAAVSLSIESRSPYGTGGSAPSTQTQILTRTGSENNNSIGDWDSVDLSDTDRPTRYLGNSVYRHSTTTVALRNLVIAP